MGRNDTLITPDGPAIKARRQGLGLSVERCAPEARVSIATWSNVERSKKVTPLTVGKITTTLDRLEVERRSSQPQAVTLEMILDVVVADRKALIAQLGEIQALVESLKSERDAHQSGDEQPRGNPS